MYWVRNREASMRFSRLAGGVLGGLVTLVTACGEPQAPSGSQAGATAATSRAAASAPLSASAVAGSSSGTNSAKPTATTAMPAGELKKALATRVLGKGITVLGENAGPGDRGGGLSFAGWGELIGGDPGCAGFFQEHQETPVSFAWVQLERRDSTNTRNLLFFELTESYASEGEARRVMAANEEAASNCRFFKLKFTDDGSTAEFVLIWNKETNDGVDYFWTSAQGETSTGQTLSFQSEEVRLGSEMMHLIVATGDEGPASIAKRQFVTVVNAYRRENPSVAP